MKKTPQKFSDENETTRSKQETMLSRRSFLNTAGVATVGSLVVAAGGSLLAEREAKAATAPEAPPLPWKYAKLDPMEAGKRGYKNYLEKGG
ncbi:MAG: hypothetical protein V1706_14955 [Pseudomonadota bacterium]